MNDYINMCKFATEIQSLWDPIIGDIICIKNKVMRYMGLTTSDVTWLPRAGQLQKVALQIIQVEDYFPDVFSKYDVWFRHTNYKFIGAEHYWLLFVMEEGFSKHWNNKSWVTQGSSFLPPKNGLSDCPVRPF